MDDLVPTGLPSGWDNIIQTSSGLGDVVSTGSSSAWYDLIPSDTDSGSLVTPTMTLSVSVSSTMVANSSTTYISRTTKKHKTHHKYHGPKCPHGCARPTKSHHKSKPNCASMGTGIWIRPTGRPHHKSHHKPYTTFSTTFPSSNSETSSEEYPTAMASSSTNKPNKSKYYQSTVTPNPISLSNMPSEEYLTTTALSRRYTVSPRGATLVTRRWDPRARMMKRYRVSSSSRAKTSCSTTSTSYSRKSKHTHKYKTHNSTLPSSTQSSKLPHPTTKSPKGISCRKTPGQTHQVYEPELKAALLSFCQNMTNPLPVITLYKPLQLLVPNITVTGTDILGTDSGSCALGMPPPLFPPLTRAKIIVQ